MSHIAPVFTVNSVKDALPWYERVLDLRPTFLSSDPDESPLVYAVLGRDGVRLHLGRAEEMRVSPGQSGCQINIEEFDDYYERAVAEAVEFYIPLGRNPVGERCFGITDPDGNQIVVTELSSD